MICDATLCQKRWETAFTGTCSWSKNWKGRDWVIMCIPFVLQASSSCLCFSLGLEEINESPENWMLLEEAVRFSLFLCPEWDVFNNTLASSTQCKTINVIRAFIQGMYPLHNNGGSKKCAPSHSDECVRKHWDGEPVKCSPSQSRITNLWWWVSSVTLIPAIQKYSGNWMSERRLLLKWSLALGCEPAQPKPSSKEPS